MQKGTPERGIQLIQYVQDNACRLEAGEITRLPTYQDLADKFRYKSSGSLYAFLKRRGLVLGELKTSEKPCTIPEPSVDLSWFLGVLSAGGSVDQDSGKIRLTSAHANVLEKYSLIGERLFSLNVHGRPNGERKGWSRPGYEFYSVKVAEFLGDLRDDVWARTILSAHPWLIDNSRYSWGFITGFFEKRGNIYSNEMQDHQNHHLVLLSTSSQSGANLLLEMLSREGLDHANLRHSFVPVEKVRGVTITDFKSINLFAQHVHSVIPKKEEGLEGYRIADLGESAIRGRRYTREKIIQEWWDIGNELG